MKARFGFDFFKNRPILIRPFQYQGKIDQAGTRFGLNSRVFPRNMFHARSSVIRIELVHSRTTVLRLTKNKYPENKK
jgi:hypothetical protein